MDLVEQLVEVTLCGEPLPDFLHQILGDVNGAGTPVVFEGELVGGVFGTAVVTATRRSAAGAVNQAQGAGEERTGKGQALEACLEHTAYQGGMVRDAHGQPPDGRQEPERRKAYRGRGKTARCEKNKSGDY
jgi:hypothetical protein